MPDKKLTLLLSSFLLLPVMLVWFQITTSYLGPKWGYITGLIGYWCYCLLSGSNWRRFESAWRSASGRRYAWWIPAAAFLPVIPTFFFLFLPIASKLTLATASLAIVVSVVNGPVEEFYWRGLYLLEYGDDKRVGFFLSTLLFGAWHFAVWFAKGVHYKEGIFLLVGGAYILGMLWAWVTRSTGNFRTAAFAHMLLNLCALSALFADNGF